MPEWIQLGRRRSDIAFMVDFHKKRSMVRANTKWIDGFALEEIVPGPNGTYPGMVLVHQKWDDIYFVNEREDWDEDDYFFFAEKRFKELNIEEHGEDNDSGMD